VQLLDFRLEVARAGHTGAILLILGTATAMAWCLTRSGFSNDLAAIMKGLPGGSGTFMAVSIVASVVVLGSVLEGIPAIVLFWPFLCPIAQAVGINKVHYAMGGDPRHGAWSVRAAVRRRLLCRLDDWACRSV
jgi:TRAP-type C4-dicarboxylate transport system permease large subunit